MYQEREGRSSGVLPDILARDGTQWALGVNSLNTCVHSQDSSHVGDDLQLL